LLHILWVTLLLVGGLPPLHAPVPVSPSPPVSAPKLKLVVAPEPVVSQERFISTEGMAEVEPQENARFVSDKHTRLSAREQGRQDSAMPQQTGVQKPGLTVVEQPELRPSEKPSQPMSEPAPEMAQVQPQEAQPPPPHQDVAPPPVPSALTIRPLAQETPSKNPPSKRPEMPPPVASPPKPREAASPAQPFSFREEKSALEGGAAPMGDSSVDAKPTPLGKYKGKIYNLIGSQWRFMVAKQASMLNYGTVRIRFVVRSNGSLAEINVLGNSSGSAMLQTISEQSIRMVAPFPSFPPSVREQVGESYPMDVNFTIY
jgi:TonB family protein